MVSLTNIPFDVTASSDTTAPAPAFFGFTGMFTDSFKIGYRDLGSILTDLINRDKEFVEGIELARVQLRKGEVVTYEEVFGG